MKKTVVVCLLILCMLLSACSVVAKAEPLVMAMLEAISEERKEDAFALIYTDSGITEADFNASFKQMHNALDGTTVEEFTYENLTVNRNVSISTGLFGRTEVGRCLAKLDNGKTFLIDYCYAKSALGEGFTSFWITEQIPETDGNTM